MSRIPDMTPEEAEVRLTALLLGELAAEEAAAVRRTLEAHPDLARQYAQLQQTVELVRQAANQPIEDAATPAPPLKLSEERRQQLIQTFRTVVSKEFTTQKRREVAWLIPMGIAAMLMALLGVLAAIPMSQRSKRSMAPLAMRVSGHEAAKTPASQGVATFSAADAETPKMARELIALPKLEEAAAAPAKPVASPTEPTAVAWSFDRAAPVASAGLNFGEFKADGVAPTGATEGRTGGDGGGGFGGGGLASAPPSSNSDRPLLQATEDGTGPGFRFQSGADITDKSFLQAGAQPGNVPATNPTEPGPRERMPVLGDTPLVGRLYQEETEKAEARKDSLDVAGKSDSYYALDSARNPEPAQQAAPALTFSLTAPPEQQEKEKQAGAANGSVLFSGTGVAQSAQGPRSTELADGTRREDAPPPTLQVEGAIVTGEASRPTEKNFGYFDLKAQAAAGTTLGLPLTTQVPTPEVLKRAEASVAQTGIPSADAAGTVIAGKPTALARNEKLADPEIQKRIPDVTLGQEARRGKVPFKEDSRVMEEKPWNPSAAFGDRDSDGMITTLEPETMRGFERERIQAEVRAKQYQKQLDQLDQSKATTAATGDGSNVQMAGQRPSGDTKREALEAQIAAQLATARTLSNEIARAKEREAQETGRYRPHFLLKKNQASSNQVTQKIADNISLQIAQERDAAIGPARAVGFVDHAKAESDEKASFWQQLRSGLTGNYERSARVEVQQQNPDVAPLLFGTQPQTTFDPYFLQTEMEKVKSKDVLYRVIDKLHLNQEWARRNGAGPNPTKEQTYQLLLKKVEVSQRQSTSLIDIKVSSTKPEEAAQIANAIGETFRDSREEAGRAALRQNVDHLKAKLAEAQAAAKTEATNAPASQQTDLPPPKPAASAPIPQPEVQTSENAFSTFSLNVSDVSYKLAAASLEKGQMPEPATIRSEEFLNAFDYRDPEPPPNAPIAFAWERARSPFAHDRDLLRFSIKTAALGRATGRPLNLVLLLDNSGSMERADRVQIVQEALRVLAGQLQPQDKLSIISFARTARLWADGVPGSQTSHVIEQVSSLTPEGGTNLEDALNLAYQTALKYYLQAGINRVVLLTDGAANLGNVDTDALRQKVEAHRQKGIALDCFGIGWEGFNDNLLEVLSTHGDGRYGFLNTPEEAASRFAGQLAGALRVAAADVKVQVEFNPKRVRAYRQIGYAKHQLTQQQFRDNTVDAAELGAAESGNALYLVHVDSRGDGPLGTVRVRYKVPGTSDYREQEWTVPYTGNVAGLDQASPALRLAGTAAAFSEWLVSSPFAAEVTPDRLLACLIGVPDVYSADPRPRQMEWMIRQAKSLRAK